MWRAPTHDNRWNKLLHNSIIFHRKLSSYFSKWSDIFANEQSSWQRAESLRTKAHVIRVQILGGNIKFCAPLLCKLKLVNTYEKPGAADILKSDSDATRMHKVFKIKLEAYLFAPVLRTQLSSRGPRRGLICEYSSTAAFQLPISMSQQQQQQRKFLYAITNDIITEQYCG